MEAPTLKTWEVSVSLPSKTSEKGGKGREHTVQSLHLSPNLATVVWHWIEPCERQPELSHRVGEPLRSSLSSRKSSWAANHFFLFFTLRGSLPS